MPTVPFSPTLTPPSVADATIPAQPTAHPAPLPHPTPCPSWCKDRRHAAGNHFGPSVTWHWSPQYRLTNPAPLYGVDPVVLRAELVRSDEGDATGTASLYVSGETDMELSAAEADAFIANLVAFVETLRVLRRQMG